MVKCIVVFCVGFVVGHYADGVLPYVKGKALELIKRLKGE